jgi:hypothetical protein
MGRKVTNQILDDIENGFLDGEEVLRACLRYMSEDEVYDMAVRSDFIIEDKEVYDFDDEDDLSFEQRILNRHESF